MKIMTKAMALTIVGLFALSSIPTDCWSESFTDNQITAGEGTFRVAMQDDIKTLNPLVAGDVWTWNVIKHLYDTPIKLDNETNELAPYIAYGSANVSGIGIDGLWGEDDATNGTFGLTPEADWDDPAKAEATIFYDFTNVTWHDDTQMSIRDVLFSYHVQAQLPAWVSSVKCLMDLGGESGSNYSSTHWLHIYPVWESGDSLKAALRFQLQVPYADFFRETLDVFLIPYHIWASTISDQPFNDMAIWYDPGYAPGNADAWDAGIATAWDNPSPVGSNQFEFDYWVIGVSSQLLTWRDHFYDENYTYSSDGKEPGIDAMNFKIYKTAEQAVLALKNDDVDYIAWYIPPTFVQELVNEPDISMQFSPNPGFAYLGYNMRRESFGYNASASFPYAPEDDIGKPLRKAIARCIDKEKIVQRLLQNFGIAGNGPINPISIWYNDTIPKYAFNPDEAKNILWDAGYRPETGGIDDAGPGNWWLNPDGSPIGSEAGGKIEILTPPADYDPIRAQTGLMIAMQLQEIGIYAQSIAMDFGTIVQRIDQRDFDMYILSWKIESGPVDYLYDFFHSSNAQAGLNYPGYQNDSYDAVIDGARATGDEVDRLKGVKDAQAAIAYDLPYDVLYFRTIIEAYRSANFVGWEVDEYGTLFNWETIVNLRRPSTPRLSADFVTPPSAMTSNSTVIIEVLIRDPDSVPVQDADVRVDCTSGSFSVASGVTNSAGKFNTFFTAPYVPPTQDNINNGTLVVIEMEEASHAGYDPAPARVIVITVYPESVPILSVTVVADPDLIYDVDGGGDPGISYITVTVEDKDSVPVSGAYVVVTVSPNIPVITPSNATTDASGIALFTLTSTDLPNDDNSVNAFTVSALANMTGYKNGTASDNVNIIDWNGFSPQPVTPPQVTSNTPTGTEIPVTTTISATFNESMNDTSVGYAFSILPSVTGPFSWNSNYTTITFTPSVNLTQNTTYTITINGSVAKDIAGNMLDGNGNDVADGSPVDDFSWSFTTWVDTDIDGIPDATDDDDDNDGWNDTIEEQVGTDPLDETSVPVDTDDDGDPDALDDDDDNDGFLDTWEEFLGTNSTDANDTPVDTDQDGIPNGDANNTQPWMDTDDDGDGVIDSEDYDPLDPTVSEPPPPDDPGILEYWWAILLIVIISIVAVSLMLKRKKPKIPSESEVAEPPPAEETEIPEPPETTMLCPTCGFEIEPGATCPFCADTPEIPEPPAHEP